MDMKSYTAEDIREHAENGAQIWALRTDTGDDDVLVSWPGEDEESVWGDILLHFDLDVPPEGWSLEMVPEEDIPAVIG